MKITCKETFRRGKGSLCYFNINSFAFNSIGKASPVPCRPECRALRGGVGVRTGVAPALFKDLVIK